jgi:NTP pyrophosphatase (non-canonical NTP hydrolase)
VNRDFCSDYLAFVNKKSCCKGGSAKKRMAHGLCGLLDELGELHKCFKHSIFYGQRFNAVNFLEELGDLTWYLAEYSIGFEKYTAIPMLALQLFSEERELPDKTEDNLKILHTGIYTLDMFDWGLCKSFPTDITPTTVEEVINSIKVIVLSIRGLGEPFRFNLTKIMEANIAKLDTRYADGGFTKDEAEHRDLKAEEEALKKH